MSNNSYHDIARDLFDTWNNHRLKMGFPSAGTFDYLPSEYREAWKEVAKRAEYLYQIKGK